MIYERKSPGDIRFDKNVASLAFRHCPDPALPSLISSKLREDSTANLTGNTGVVVSVIDSTKKCKTLNVRVIQSKDPFGRLTPGSDFKVLHTQNATECRPSPKRPAISPQEAYYTYPNNNPLFTVFDTLATPCRHVSVTTLKKNRAGSSRIWRVPVRSKRWSVTVYDAQAGTVIYLEDIYKKTSRIKIPSSVYSEAQGHKFVYVQAFIRPAFFMIH